MIEFEKLLDNDEYILYQGKAVSGKGNKNIFGSIIIILFMSFIQFALIWSLVTGTGDGANGIGFDFIGIFIISLLFDGVAIYNIIYLLFIKDKAVNDDYFCITNKRVLKYEQNKVKLVYGYLINYESIEVINEKKQFGDVQMFGALKKSDNAKQDLMQIKNMLFDQDPTNMKMMILESIENPDMVVNIIKKAREELLKNNNEKNYK